MPGILCCRSCGKKNFESVLDLGQTPLANALRTAEECNEKEESFPLHLVRCTECSLLQITENVPSEKLFSHYFYRSSFSDAFLLHCKTLADTLITERALDADSLVIDIASNDGYLLRFYKEKGIPILGVEPAKNIAAFATERGIPTRTKFFTAAEAAAMVREGCAADVIHANNVMPHVADQQDFAAGIKILLKPKGIAVIECAYACDTIDHTEFDQIYHEHMCYFSLTALQRLCASHGLTVVSAKRIAVHGGSLRVVLGHEGALQDASVRKILDEEQAWGVDTPAPYRAFAARVETLKKELLKLLNDLKSRGKRIAVYGASAKGSTLMNAFGIGKDVVDYIVDRSTMKQGLFAPGTHLEICPVERLLADKPDYTLLLTWNFAEEILEQQKEYRVQGGKFILPVPEVRVV